MKILGIIAEYNPFHNGHQYHIHKSLEKTGCDAAIIVMSGDFVQRGAPAIYSKHLRASMALLEGASAVFELPCHFACGSAEYFAKGAVALLNALGCVDTLCFGSEIGKIDTLSEIAEILYHEPDPFPEKLRYYLRKGHAFPAARQLALQDFLHSSKSAEVLNTPNNSLGIEYLKALKYFGSSIQPDTIPRIGDAYHAADATQQYASATAIRELLKSVKISDHQKISLLIPPQAYARLRTSEKELCPILPNDFSLLLRYCLLRENAKSLQQYADVSEELANRIIHTRNQFRNWEQYCQLLKTKEITYSRISRALLHILLNIRAEDMSSLAESGYCTYARLLGFSKQSAEVLKEIKECSSVPVLTKLSTLPDHILDSRLLSTDIYASNLYETVYSDKYEEPFVHEFEKPFIVSES